MKIVALGGCGQEGRTSVRALLQDERVERLVVADRDVARADAFVAELSDRRLSVAHVDVTDTPRLMEVLAGADVVANFVGPYYRFGQLTLAAAIRAGVNYVDINDDTDATAQCMALSDEASAAGVTAVVGLGASPGLSNVMARYAAEQLDQADRIDIRWQVSITDVDQSAGISAALLHFLHAVDGEVPQFIDGELRPVPAYSGEETVDFRSIGARQAYFTAHPEPLTLSRSLKGVRDVTCKGGVAGLDEIVPILRLLGLTSDEPLDLGDCTISPRLVALALLDRLPAPDPAPPPVSGLQVIASGFKAGHPARFAMEVMQPASMTLLTGLPTAAGIQMLAAGEVRSSGVLPPEEAFEASSFLQRVKRLGVEIHEGFEG